MAAPETRATTARAAATPTTSLAPVPGLVVVPVEPAVVPLKPSGKGVLIYASIFIFLSVVGTIGWQLFGKEFSHSFKLEMQNK